MFASFQHAGAFGLPLNEDFRLSAHLAQMLASQGKCGEASVTKATAILGAMVDERLVHSPWQAVAGRHEDLFG